MYMSQYQQQLRAMIISLNFSTSELHVLANLKEEHLMITMNSEDLRLHIMLQRINTVVVKPASKVTHKSNDVTIGNEISPDKNITTHKNLVSQVNIMYN